MKHKLTKIPLFPKIYRFITEQWVIIFVSFLSGLMTIAIAIQGLILRENLKIEKSLESDRMKTEQELKYWKKEAQKYTDYRDLDFKIANLEYKLGHIDEARNYLKKVMEIDPNFEKGREMEKQIGL